jgi:hypothetical protein
MVAQGVNLDIPGVHRLGKGEGLQAMLLQTGAGEHRGEVAICRARGRDPDFEVSDCIGGIRPIGG